MKQFAILFAAVCAIAIMANESQAQCGGFGGGRGGFVPSRSVGFGGGFGGFNSFARPVYSRPVYSGYRGGFGGFGPSFGGFNRGVSINVGRGFGGGFGGFNSFGRGFKY